MHIPSRVRYGLDTDGRYVLVTSRVFGQRLREGRQDAKLLPLALVALRAIHAQGYLVGARRRVRSCSVLSDCWSTARESHEARPEQALVPNPSCCELKHCIWMEIQAT